MPINLKYFLQDTSEMIKLSTDYEDSAYWMKSHVPAGKTIYHTGWDSSSYFICLNPKNDYINVQDPIYMFYPYPKEYIIYRNLDDGKFSKPHEVLQRIFKVNYGYVKKNTGLYWQIKNDTEHFHVLYENDLGIVFRV
jgi:hypothetical protein